MAIGWDNARAADVHRRSRDNGRANNQLTRSQTDKHTNISILDIIAFIIMSLPPRALPLSEQPVVLQPNLYKRFRYVFRPCEQ